MTLFAPIFVPAELREATSDRGWLEAMLDAERALANAEALVGVIPADAAGAIAECCRSELFDPVELAEQGRAVANPVEPLVRALREKAGDEAARYVHWGATSQDVMDTAAMLVSRRALGQILDELDRVAAACARCAEAYREAPLAGRTLLQQAVPTTFGLKAAGWLVAVLEVRSELLRVQVDGLAVQLGGAAGTLASLGEQGPEVVALFAAQLELPEPTLPWHTNRVRIARLGGALAVAAGALAKIGLDVALLAQSEVAEVAEAAGGGSSTMPQKRNPTGSTRALACARQVTAQAAVLAASLVQEHERAIGAWQAEWDALASALALTGGATASIADVLEGLEVDAERMRSNIEETTLAERAVFELGVERAELESRSLREVLVERLSPDELERVLDPATYVGSAGVFVDRALALYAASEEDEL